MLCTCVHFQLNSLPPDQLDKDESVPFECLVLLLMCHFLRVLRASGNTHSASLLLLNHIKKGAAATSPPSGLIQILHFLTIFSFSGDWL